MEYVAPGIIPLECGGVGVDFAGGGVDDGVVCDAAVDVVKVELGYESAGSVEACLCISERTCVVNGVAHGLPCEFVVVSI